MTHVPVETLLTGGNVNQVVKVGDTVRRLTGSHSKTVHEFLRHLETTCVPIPKLLGIDDEGREILSYIEGETTFSQGLWKTDTALVASVELLRRFHDASLSFVPTKPVVWGFEYPNITQHEVICHNDFAPYNMVFRHGSPIGILDFDLCGPGPRIRDVAYLAYWMVPMSFGSGDLQNLSLQDVGLRCRRFRMICATYGIDDPVSLLRMISEVLHHMASPEAVQKIVGAASAERLRSGGHFDHWAGQAAAFDDTLHDLIAIVT